MSLSSQQPVYMDNHATTRVDPRVLERMLPYFSEHYGNAGSVGHVFGDEAREAVAESQATIACCIGAEPDEIVFTSGATESNNLAIRGVAERTRRRGDHLISVVTEHKAVLDPLERLARQGRKVTLLEVEPHGSPNAGILNPQQVAHAIRDDTCLVSIMLANNEIGVIQPLAEVAAICKDRGVLLHCDATQAVGKILVDMQALQVDLMSFSAHKIYGPKGVGALYVRQREPIVRLEPQITGGGQQRGRRSGTHNVPGIVGFAAALELCQHEMPLETERLTRLRNQLATSLTQEIDGVELCGPELMVKTSVGIPLRLPGNLNLSFQGMDGEALMLAMPGLAVSSGAACTSTSPEPSHVLRALGLSEEATRSSLRFGLGRFNSEAEVAFATEAVTKAVKQLRQLGNNG